MNSASFVDLPSFTRFRRGAVSYVGEGPKNTRLSDGSYVPGVHTLPPVVGLVLPVLAGLFLLLEVFAAPAYATGGNPALIAVVDALFIAWITAVTIPVV